ncbi:LOW QUALITY PROTEIN: uncharacterized protein [Amphiura filiformis]|uniref:LOW QUALITY PROTEIN: uncharacterized protein n=1 Tax=Amphiura filiformis TaxID=82378 RepID=UPI003B211934
MILGEEPSKPQSTSVSYVFFSQTIQNGLAAMHSSFRALHQQCLLTSLACRYKLHPTPVLSQVLFRTRSSSLLPLSICVPNPVSVAKKCVYNNHQQSAAINHSIAASLDKGALGDFNCHYINAEERQNFYILSAIYPSEMPKRKRSRSEHSKSERSHTEHSKKHSHSKQSRSSSKKRGTASKRGKGVQFDDESKKAIANIAHSMRRRSHGAATDVRSHGAATDVRSGSAPKSRKATTKSEENMEDKHAQHSTHTHPPGRSEFAKVKSSTTSSTSQSRHKCLTPPPGQCGFTQRDFSTYAPSLYQMQKQSQPSTPPPGWSTFAKSGFSTTASRPEKKQDGLDSQLPSKDTSSGGKGKIPSSTKANHDEDIKANPKTSQGSMRREPNDFQRHWKDTSLGRRHKSKPYTGVDFTVMSYNVLAQKLISMNDYLYHHCPRHILDWEYRKMNLLQEIADINSDIVCLQEVQGTHFTSFYEPAMKNLGYSGVFKQRTGDKHDGCATFFKNSHFDLVDCKRLEYRRHNVPLLDRDNVAVIVLLQPKGICQSERICVANTHLLYNPKRGDIKLTQLGMLLAEIDKLSYIPTPDNESHRYHPVIMCGDFNSLPQCSLVEFIQLGTLYYEGLRAVDVSGQEPWKHTRNLSSPLWPSGVGVTDGCQYERVLQQRLPGSKNNSSSQPQLSSISDTTPEAKDDDYCNISSVLDHPFQFNSSYVYNEDSKEVTTNHGRTNCTVDYIFYSSETVCIKEDTKQLRILSRLSLFTDEEANEMGGLPNARWASDHFSLAVKFLLVPNDEDTRNK